jgi:hypothetical protein
MRVSGDRGVRFIRLSFVSGSFAEEHVTEDLLRGVGGREASEEKFDGIGKNLMTELVQR